MLSQIQIENIGIIESLNLDLNAGLNVLTGETGAGKSIIISSFSLILGERIKPQETIRTGREYGKVCALFHLNESHPAVLHLVNHGIGVREGEIMIQREVNLNGKNKCWINGSIVSIGMLKELGDLLVDIHGAHDHQKLLTPSTHLDYLDRYAKTEGESRLYFSLYERWMEKKNQLNEIIKDESALRDKLEFLKFQINELSYLEQLDSSEEEIEREFEILNNASHIKELCVRALETGSDSEGSLINNLKKFKSYVRDLSEVDPSFSDILDELESLSISLAEACAKIGSFNQSIQPDAGRLQKLEERWITIKKHEKKYGKNLEELKKHFHTLKEQLELVENPPDTETIRNQIRNLEQELEAAGKDLTAKRKSAAAKLKKDIEKELKSLGMEHARIIIDFESISLSPKGADKIEFLLITNPGEKEKPLVQIASGGELCRIMLAFKAIFASLDDIPILIFDEIDSNIGGVTSVAAAKKMISIASQRQVIVITHQAQIASRANTHFAVVKIQNKTETRTVVRELSHEERIEEISRMLGGVQITTVVRKHAKEMLEQNC
ncbi:MAG: DNA repair protein RecN [Candidatus Aureabacteria bacterium]|nr:DNA repair protein RecN [Candidatus Auribacterota bacterium]